MEFRPWPAGGASPGTDPAALRLITTAVVVGLVITGLAVAPWRGLVSAAAARPAAAPSGRAQTAGLRLLSRAAQAWRSVPYQGVEVAWWGPGGGDTSMVNVWHQPGRQALTQAPQPSVEWPSRPGQRVPLAMPGGTDLSEAGVLGMSSRLVALLGANYVVNVAGRGRVAGRPPASSPCGAAVAAWPPGSGWTVPRTCRCARKCSTPGRT